MIFSKKSDAALASLVKQLDGLIEEHKDAKLKAFVNLLGDDRDKLEKQAAKLVDDQKIKNIPVVVPVEYEDGPANYGLNPDAGLTVLFYRRMEVKTSRAFGASEFTKDQVSKLLEDVSKIVE